MKFQSWLAQMTGDCIGENIVVLNPCFGGLIIERRVKFIWGHITEQIFIMVYSNLFHLWYLVEFENMLNIQTEFGKSWYEVSCWNRLPCHQIWFCYFISLSVTAFICFLFRNIGNRIFFISNPWFLDLVKPANFLIMCTDKYKE